MLPCARKESLIVQELEGEILIYDAEANRALCLNQTSALVWENCDGSKDVAKIAELVEEKLGDPVSEDFVWFAVNQLNKENLLKPPVDFTDKFAGLSRREVIKKIGIGTMIALPVVASVVAPSAINAQSNCVPAAMNPVGCPCSTPSDCAGGSCGMTTPGICG